LAHVQELRSAVVDLFDDPAAELAADEFHSGQIGARPGRIVRPLFLGRSGLRPGCIRAAPPARALSAAGAPGGPLTLDSARVSGWPAPVSVVRRGQRARRVLALSRSA
jgi:hypothetical protein